MELSVPEKVCDICGKVYKRKLHHFAAEFLPVIDSSHVRVQIEGDRTSEFFDFDTCPICAHRILRTVIDLQRNRPIKCEFCEFDKGPRYDGAKPEHCKTCSDYSEFQLKKKMCVRQNYEWQQYKRYFGEVDE